MQIDTVRFGQIEVETDKSITFAEGLPGFEDLKKFILLSPEQTRPIYWMQALDDGGIALPVISSFDVLGDYSLDIPDDVMKELDLDKLEDLLVMNVCVIPEDLSQMTANLAAPILINIRLNEGKQIIVDSKDYPTRYPVFGDIVKLMKGDDADAGTDSKD